MGILPTTTILRSVIRNNAVARLHYALRNAERHLVRAAAARRWRAVQRLQRQKKQLRAALALWSADV